MEDRIPTHVWVDAKIRELFSRNIPAFVLAKGNLTGGLVLVKVNDLQGFCVLYGQQRNVSGNLEWITLMEKKDEKAVDTYILQERDFDPDLWVLEIEDKSLSNPFQKPNDPVR